MEKRFEWRSHPLPRRVVVITGKPDVDDLHETVRKRMLKSNRLGPSYP